MNTTVLGGLAGQMLGERYLVGEPIARGGMATVYLATDTRLQRTVALKVLRQDLSADADFMERFQREALATAALSHPNVVAVFDFDAEDGLAFLVLEYVPGQTLRHLMARHRLTPAQALAVMEPILDALVVAHDVGIVHRDIKPENVLLGPRGAVKVADFGLARALDDHEHKTRTGLVIGTAAYVSPEHIAGTGTGAPSDVYSAGILLFELLTGAPPYAGENALSVAFQHVNSDVPRPSERVAGLPTELDDLVLGATAKDPAARFDSAAAFLAELRRVRSLMPVAQPLPGPEPRSETLVLAGAAADPTADAEIIDLADEPDGDPDATSMLAAATGAAAPDDTAALVTPDESDAAPGEGQPRKRRRGRFLLSALLLVALIGGATWAFLAGPLQRATVPDLAGLTQTDATAVLEESGLRLDVGDQQYSETAPKDTVISQDPAAQAGTFIRFPVSVVVSLGPERYGVPQLRGQTVAEATTALQDTKLAVAGQQTAYDEEIEKGLVAGTDPPTGTSLKPATEVTLIVSDGPAPRPVPDVLGKDSEQAVSALEAAGLVAELDEAFNEQYPAGQIAVVAPKVGTEVAKGSTVALTVSKGPPPVEVPRVVDMKRDDAIARLRNAGFQVRVQEGIVTPLNRVYSQDPPPGEFRPKGSTVTISIF
jgi:beta-lactam-binding protein with PASTA domain/tRNA A-37 threonylcarbamoyl transferase component Bud32